MRDATHKLSKRDGDAYYSDYIEKGFLTEALINYLALVGWNPGTDQEFFTLPELVEVFDIHRINNSPGIFDVNKLEWMNGQYVVHERGFAVVNVGDNGDIPNVFPNHEG